MKIKIGVLCLLICSGSALKSQVHSDFDKYASMQDSIMIKAYEKRDAVAFNATLNSFLAKYNALDNNSRKMYQAHLLNDYYNFACLYALLGDKAKALKYLEKSKYSDYKHLSTDPDLVSIRNESRFKACLKYAKSCSLAYLNTLKKSAKYNDLDNRMKVKFTYQSSDNTNLKKLRDTYKLDSIAGTGNDVSRLLNVLHWVHYLIPHDGNIRNPKVMNAMSMIPVCQNEKRGLNCWGLSVVLNECYLALGYKSRYVRCLPKDSTDMDCHVIVTAYSATLKKWLWLDPTFNAYVMNRKGELLSIQEVRERLVEGKPLILSPEANWNRKFTEDKDAYLYHYMAKNLYMLESPINSEYDYETYAKGKIFKYLYLCPLDYKGNKQREQKITRKSSTYESFATTNPTIFWAKPE